jgi:hypothetical protein
VEAHTKKKADLKNGHWYTQKPGELSVSVSPTLDDEIASKSAIWSMYQTGLYRSSAWDSVMSYVKSNAAASSSDSVLTEAASAGVVLGTFSEANPIPKTPSFRASLREATATRSPTAEVLASVLDTGLKRAEESVSDVYAELVKVSARIGRPSDPSLSHGSAYSDLEALQFYVSEVDSKCKESSETIQVHEGKFRLVDENFRKCSLTLNQVVSTATQAFATAADAKNNLTALNTTGSLGAISNHHHTISQLEKQVAEQQREITTVTGLVEKVLALLASQGTNAANTSTNSLEAQVKSLGAELAALRSGVNEQLKLVRQSIDGQGPIKIGSHIFDGPKSCAEVLAKMNITVDVIEYLMDPFHILASLLHQTRSREDVNTSAILSMKAQQSPGRLTAMASYETMHPEIFCGARASRTDVASTSNFCSIKTPELWDAGDGETGVKNFIEHMLIDFVPQFATQVEQVFGDSHPEFCELATLLCQRSATALQELCRELSDLFTTLRTKTYGQASSYTAAQKAEAWNFVLILLQVYCHEMYKARANGRNLNAYSDPCTANALALSATVGSLGVHARFKSFQFREHPRIFPKLQNYTLQKCVRKADIEGIESEAKKALTVATRVEASHKSLALLVDQNATSFGTFKRKVELAVDLGTPAKKKPNRRQPKKGGGEGDEED